MESFAHVETGEKFSFIGREYLLLPYNDKHPNQVHKKCTQVGITTMAIFWALYACMFEKYPKGVIYFFPTDRDVTDFSRGRVGPIIEYNEEIKDKVIDTDTVGMKRVGKAFLYLRGMRSKSQLKSIPADEIIIDELDEVEDQTAPEMAIKRLSASDFQCQKYLSNPTIPDYGIDKKFQVSDQKHYMLKCPHCGEWNCLEDMFPKCLVKTKDTVILGCHKCERELDKSQGEWVAKFPSVKDCSGYQYSQLFAPKITAKQIYDEYMKALKEGKLANFMNLTLGQAYISAQNRLTVEQVLSLVDNEFPSDFWAIPAPCYMGVDQGKDLHIVFKKRLKDRVAVLPALEFDFNALDKYMQHISVCVIDGLPETRNAKAFAERNQGKVYLNYYNEHQKGSYRWNDEEMTVQENRTESMDASHEQISSGTIILPPYCQDLVKEYANHCHNTAKKLHEDEETGSRRYLWVKLGADHYRHADNYATIAMSGANNMPTGSYF